MSANVFCAKSKATGTNEFTFRRLVKHPLKEFKASGGCPESGRSS